MKIADHDLSKAVYIIAEAGNCHEGDFDLALRLVKLAAEAGANAIKFQTIVPERLVASSEPTRRTQLKRFQLTPEHFGALAHTAREAGIHFMSTPFDCESVGWLDPLVPAFKIASGDNDFLPLLDAVARTAKPVLLSTGLADLHTVRAAADRIRAIWKASGITQGLALLHCVCAYPTPDEQAALARIPLLATLGATVGYSDHTLGIDAALLSVALGARVVEKHFTISKTHSDFQDHKLAADPDELARLVRSIRRAEKLLGHPGDEERPCENAAQVLARRSIATRRELPAGHVLRMEDLDWLRPGDGLRPGCEAQVIGHRLSRPMQAGEIIRPADVESMEVGTACAASLDT